MAVPPIVGFLVTLTDWRSALWLIAGLGVAVAVAVVVRWLLPLEPTSKNQPDEVPQAVRSASAAQTGRPGFRLLVAIGMLGEAVCGRLGDRFGVTRTVILTETGTVAAILAVIVLPLVPEPAPGGRVEKAFAVFYTWTLGGSALAAPVIYGRLGDAVGSSWAAIATAATALAVVPVMLRLSPRFSANAVSRNP